MNIPVIKYICKGTRCVRTLHVNASVDLMAAIIRMAKYAIFKHFQIFQYYFDILIV